MNIFDVFFHQIYVRCSDGRGYSVGYISFNVYGWVGLSVRHMKSSLDSSVFNDEENIPGGKPILIQLHFILIYSAESMSL